MIHIPPCPSDDVLDGLRHDMDSVDVNEYGLSLVLRFEPDDMSLLDEQGEGMWCGRLEWGRRNSDTGYAERPRDFTGGAEKIQTYHGDTIWWEVPADLRKPDMVESKKACREVIVDILNHGYCYISLRLYQDGEEVKREGLGGIEPFPDKDYVREVVRELAAELFNDDLYPCDPDRAAAELPVLLGV